MRSILGLDTATHTGWAVRKSDGSLACGLWSLDFGPGRPHASRYLNLLDNLNFALREWGIERVVAEKPVVMPGRESAARVCFGLIATVEMWAEGVGVEYGEVQIGVLKKFATGRGNAKKPEMLAAARAKWPTLRIVDDNVADALWALDWALNPSPPVIATAAKARKRAGRCPRVVEASKTQQRANLEMEF